MLFKALEGVTKVISKSDHNIFSNFYIFFNKYQALTRYTVAQLSRTGLLSGTNIDQEPFYEFQCSFNSLFVPLYHYIWFLHYIIWRSSYLICVNDVFRDQGLWTLWCQTGSPPDRPPVPLSSCQSKYHLPITVLSSNISINIPVFLLLMWDCRDLNKACLIYNFYPKACSELQVEYSCQ